VSHLLFADDCLIFMKADGRSANKPVGLRVTGTNKVKQNLCSGMVVVDGTTTRSFIGFRSLTQDDRTSADLESRLKAITALIQQELLRAQQRMKSQADKKRENLK